MKEMCVKCGICCKLIPIDWENKLLLRNGIESFDENFEDNLIPLSRMDAENINNSYVKSINSIFPDAEFFSCKYYNEGNGCSCDSVPDICKNFPDNPFAFVSDECPYQGEIFLKNEAIKQKIRKLKEEVLDYEAQIANTKNKKEKEHLKKIIIFHQKFIGKYKKYGSNNW